MGFAVGAFALVACGGPPARSLARPRSRLTVELDVAAEAARVYAVRLGVDDVAIDLGSDRGRSEHRFVVEPGDHVLRMEVELGAGRGLVCGGTFVRSSRRLVLHDGDLQRVCGWIDLTVLGEWDVGLEPAPGDEPCPTSSVRRARRRSVRSAAR